MPDRFKPDRFETAPTSQRRVDVVVVGAGFAGAATAAALVRRGVRRVAILEAESVPGHHSSGRNAAMARRVIGDPVMAQLATEGVSLIRELQRRRGVELIADVGGVLLGSEGAIAELAEVAAQVDGLSAQTRQMGLGELRVRVPALEGARAEAGLWSDGCGVVDIHELLTALLDEARAGGATVHLNTRVEEVELTAGRVSAVRTSAGDTIACDTLVNAAGFAANSVAGLAGASPLPFDPVRRHLAVSAPDGSVDRRWPFVWDVTHGVYFRPEGAGLLLCACDETRWPQGDPPTDPGVRELIAEKFTTWLPGLQHARLARIWAGIRVLTSDDRFVIGPDADVDGLYWVAGLGGHGMTTSCAVGELAAADISGAGMPGPFSAAFSPARWSVSAL